MRMTGWIGWQVPRRPQYMDEDRSFHVHSELHNVSTVEWGVNMTTSSTMYGAAYTMGQSAAELFAMYQPPLWGFQPITDQLRGLLVTLETCALIGQLLFLSRGNPINMNFTVRSKCVWLKYIWLWWTLSHQDYFDQCDRCNTMSP